MCFSATSSFSAGVILTVIGIASLKKTTKPSERLFAAIPLLFAVQQFAEGFLWITLSNSDPLQLEKIYTYVFLFIAQIVWPVWVPLSILQLDHNRLIRPLLYLFLGAGILISLYITWCFLNYDVKAEIDGYHISYLQNYPENFMRLGGYLYSVTTIFPPFLSQIKRMWLVGLAILISYTITKIYFNSYLISVWCFFAAIISSIVYLVMLKINNRSLLLKLDAKNNPS
jgi:hypothetical protein